ncbi:MAG: hypothetical protein ACKVS7_02390 [Gemmatimonadaceae bacterium]
MRHHHVFLALALVATAACGGSRSPVVNTVRIDPSVDLASHARIGLVTFTAENAKGGLVRLATQQFAEQMLQAQPGVEILELGAVTGAVDAAAARRLGEQHGVRTLVVGHLTVSDLKPRVRLLGGLTASTEVTMALQTKLLSAESGATLWARSSTLRETMQQVSIASGTAVFDAQDAKEAYGEIVGALIWNVTTDFRPTWVRQ